jgi:hypothetical protein
MNVDLEDFYKNTDIEMRMCMKEVKDPELNDRFSTAWANADWINDIMLRVMYELRDRKKEGEAVIDEMLEKLCLDKEEDKQ